MHNFLNSFKDSMLDCEIFRNGNKIATYKGLIHDSKDYNYISFYPNSDIQVGDDVYCPIKKKHYFIKNTDIRTLHGEVQSLDAYFDNNFDTPSKTTVFNTYNPTNSIIGNQQNAILNINDCFNNLDSLIKQNGNEDIDRLNELFEILKNEIKGNEINKSKLSKFSDLICKYSWLPTGITQIILAWIQGR